MVNRTTSFDEDVIRTLLSGGVAVVRTDTIYGIVAVAADETAVERIYKIKGREPTKSPIVLIAHPDQMFDDYDAGILDRLSDVWPGKNSIILPSVGAPSWIVRGNRSVAYRIPDDTALRRLLSETGPLVAPSANPEGQPPAQDITEAEGYFGEQVDIYVDGGRVIDDAPSRLFRLKDDGLERLR